VPTYTGGSAPLLHGDGVAPKDRAAESVGRRADHAEDGIGERSRKRRKKSSR
jgi:hypothetical protein